MLLVLALLVAVAAAFSPSPRLRLLNRVAATEVDVALNQYVEADALPWRLHILDEETLYPACLHLVDCFYKEPTALSSRLLDAKSPFEKSVFEFLLHWHYQLTKLDTLGVYFLGFLTRVKGRLKNPTLSMSSDSLVILASEKNDDSAIVGLVELCLEEPNGRLTTPIPMTKNGVLNPILEPYLCNLSVNPSHRGKGLGKVLCNVGENIVKNVWNKDVIYLHVEQDNAAAKLYESIGYELIANYMSPWDRKMNSMEKINYYKKLL